VIGVARTAVAAPADGQRKLESKDVAVSQRCSAIAEKVRKGVTPENALLISELRACDRLARFWARYGPYAIMTSTC
jgi:hypothetical protein